MRPPTHLCCAILCAATVLAAPAAAEILVLKADGDPAEPDEATVTIDPFTGAWRVTLSALYAPGGETTYDIHGNGGETIDEVVIDVPCWEDGNGNCTPAGSPVYVSILSEPPLGIRTVRSVVQTGTAETFVLRVEAEEDIGSVLAESIGHVIAGRDVTGPVIGTTADHPARGVFWVEAVRDVLGDVITENGRIGIVYAHRHIGSVAEPVAITAKHRINQIQGFGDVHAKINSRVNGGAGPMFAFVAGRFFGDLETERIVPDNGSGAPGRFWFGETLAGTIIIGKGFDHPAQWMQLPLGGLAGQIIINADDEPGATWISPIYLGAEGDPDRIVLTGADYDVPAGALGGGSIGLAPFGLHDESCAPVSGSTVAAGVPGAPVIVGLRHYGPVSIAGPEPIEIARRPAGSALPFASLDPGAFLASPDLDDTNVLLVGPAPGAPGFEPGYEYRLDATEALRCEVPDQPAVVWEDEYHVTVEEAACAGDLDGDGLIGLTDLVHILGHWGPCPPGPPCRGDLDANRMIELADLIMILSLWGPCA